VLSGFDFAFLRVSVLLILRFFAGREGSAPNVPGRPLTQELTADSKS